MLDITGPEIPNFYRQAATLEPSEAEVSRVLRELAARTAKHRMRRRRGRSTRVRAMLWPASLGWHLPQRGRREG